MPHLQVAPSAHVSKEAVVSHPARRPAEGDRHDRLLSLAATASHHATRTHQQQVDKHDNDDNEDVDDHHNHDVDDAMSWKREARWEMQRPYDLPVVGSVRGRHPITPSPYQGAPERGMEFRSFYGHPHHPPPPHHESFYPGCWMGPPGFGADTARGRMAASVYGTGARRLFPSPIRSTRPKPDSEDDRHQTSKDAASITKGSPKKKKKMEALGPEEEVSVSPRPPPSLDREYSHCHFDEFGYPLRAPPHRPPFYPPHAMSSYNPYAGQYFPLEEHYMRMGEGARPARKRSVPDEDTIDRPIPNRKAIASSQSEEHPDSNNRDEDGSQAKIGNKGGKDSPVSMASHQEFKKPVISPSSSVDGTLNKADEDESLKTVDMNDHHFGGTKPPALPRHPDDCHSVGPLRGPFPPYPPYPQGQMYATFPQHSHFREGPPPFGWPMHSHHAASYPPHGPSPHGRYPYPFPPGHASPGGHPYQHAHGMYPNHRSMSCPPFPPHAPSVGNDTSTTKTTKATTSKTTSSDGGKAKDDSTSNSADNPKASKSSEFGTTEESVPSDVPENIKSVADWQMATLATGMAPSANRCRPLKAPIPSKYWGEAEKMRDAPIPDFHRLVNYPDYLAKTRPSGADGTIAGSFPSGGKRHCVMCGKLRICSGTLASFTDSRPNPKKAEEDADSTIDNKDGGNENDDTTTTNNTDENGDCETTHIIPRQNKGLCTACDVTVWVVGENGLEIKWCKGCKNFRPWAAFGDKGLATKCARCRDRQREKYALQKDQLRLKRLRQVSSSNKATEEKADEDPHEMAAAKGLRDLMAASV